MVILQYLTFKTPQAELARDSLYISTCKTTLLDDKLLVLLHLYIGRQNQYFVFTKILSILFCQLIEFEKCFVHLSHFHHGCLIHCTHINLRHKGGGDGGFDILLNFLSASTP